MVVRVRGHALPDGEYVDLYADGDRWTTDPVPGAEPVAEGWLVPGLVDAHTHPGAESPGDPLDESMPRKHLHDHVDAGVTAIRSPGLPDDGDPPSWFGVAPDVPRARHAGPWLAQQGQFFEGWGDRPALADLPKAAAAQAERTGAGGVLAVAAGVDSVEHGMCLDPALLTDMAARGMVLTPTLSVLQSSLATFDQRPDSPNKRWYVEGDRPPGLGGRGR